AMALGISRNDCLHRARRAGLDRSRVSSTTPYWNCAFTPATNDDGATAATKLSDSATRAQASCAIRAVAEPLQGLPERSDHGQRGEASIEWLAYPYIGRDGLIILRP